MANVSVREPKQQRRIPMYSMKRGQYARVASTGEIVVAQLLSNGEITVLSLTNPANSWSLNTVRFGTSNGYPVELLPEGTVIEITV